MMHINTFKGTFYEIGKQQGLIYKKNKMSFDKVKIDKGLFTNQLNIYRRHYPQLLEEFKGMAETGGFDEDKLIYYFIAGELISFRTEFIQQEKACTIFGIQNKRGTFVGRNYDWHPAAQRVFELYKVYPKKRNTFLALTDMGITGTVDAKPKYLFYNADDAINDKGLFIGLTFAYNSNWTYGLSCIHMTKLIAETCDTVNDAIKIFQNVPLCYPKNFFIADKKGNMAVVEHTSRKFKVVYPDNGILIQTNNYTNPELAREDTVLQKRPTHNTFLRYYESLQKINSHKSTFQLNDAIKILGDKNSYVCQNHPNMKTIWSLALDMKNSKYKLYWNITGTRKEATIGI